MTEFSSVSSYINHLLMQVLICLVMPCLALPCLALPCLALPCLAMPCLALPCLAMPCLAMPCLAMPCLALPCHVLPYLRLIYYNFKSTNLLLVSCVNSLNYCAFFVPIYAFIFYALTHPPPLSYNISHAMPYHTVISNKLFISSWYICYCQWQRQAIQHPQDR